MYQALSSSLSLSTIRSYSSDIWTSLTSPIFSPLDWTKEEGKKDLTRNEKKRGNTKSCDLQHLSHFWTLFLSKERKISGLMPQGPAIQSLPASQFLSHLSSFSNGDDAFLPSSWSSALSSKLSSELCEKKKLRSNQVRWSLFLSAKKHSFERWEERRYSLWGRGCEWWDDGRVCLHKRRDNHIFC